MAAAVVGVPDSHLSFTDLTVRLDSLLSHFTSLLDRQSSLELEQEKESNVVELAKVEADIRVKFSEIHARLKNGNGPSGDNDDDDEESDAGAVEDFPGPNGSGSGVEGSVNCVGCSSCDEDEEVCPSPIQPKGGRRVKPAAATSSRLLTRDNVQLLLRQSFNIFKSAEGTFQPETKALAAQLVAELGRNDLGRRAALKYTEDNVSLVESVGDVLADKCPLETCVQICRIIGNLCFDCPEGRKQIIAAADRLLGRLVGAFKDKSRAAKEDPGQRLPVIFPGCMLNFCNETPDAMDAMARHGCIDVILDNVVSTKTNDAVFNASILFLTCLTEYEVGLEKLSRSNGLPNAICHILTHTTSPEVTTTMFELLRNSSESPSLVKHLAKGGLFSHLVDHINGRWQSPAFQELRTAACDILVALLAHDEAMQFVYEQEGPVFVHTFLEWIRDGEDTPLQVTAALCLGNFCCNETNCNDLIASVGPALIGALKSHHGALLRDVKLQHALLGALRNLAVAPKGRKVLLDQGILPPCLDLAAGLDLTPITQPVVMKLLGTLRLVVDGSSDVAKEIGENRVDILAQLINWGSADMGAGPRAESGRLLAGIIKNSKSKKTMKTVVSCGGLPSITIMLHSTHARMLNEALVSLTILSASLIDQQETSSDDESEDAVLVHRHLQTDLVINGVKRCFVKPASGEEFPPEVKANAATFIRTLLKVRHEEFRQMLEDLSFRQDCLPEERLKDLPPECQRLAETLQSNNSK